MLFRGKLIVRGPDAEHASRWSHRTGIFETLCTVLTIGWSGASTARRLSRGVTSLAILCASLFAFTFTAAPASAGLVHPFKFQTTGTPEGSFSEVQGIAVDPASQDVYVADEQGQVDIFNSAGVYQSQITGLSLPPGSSFRPVSVAVSDKTHDVYVASGRNGITSDVYVFNALGGYETTITGSSTESFSPNNGRFSVAVDQSSGEVYVADASAGVVDRFNSKNEYQPPQLKFPGEATGVAADSNGNVYVTVGEENRGSSVYEFNSKEEQILDITGTPSGLFSGVAGRGVAVDPLGNIYVVDRGTVDEFDSSGTFVNGTNAGASGGVAVNATGEIYVSDNSQRVVKVFGANVFVPGVGGEPATGVSDSGASLHGQVNPEGTEVVSCEFEYRTAAEPEFGHHSMACSPGTPYTGSANVPVEAALSNLEANTTYYYQLVASNAKGTVGGSGYGSEESFHTFGAPRVEGVSAEVNPTEKVGQTNATLHASIDPDGAKTTYTFEYGETTKYGTSVPFPAEEIGAGEAFVPVTAELTGLKIGTTYHYRVSASNVYGTVPSPDQTFSTLPAVLIERESVSDVAATSATLEAQIDPLGVSSTCVFQYVSDASFHSSGYAAAVSVPCPAGLGEGETGVPTSVHVQGLTAGTVYHYRARAENEVSEKMGEPVDGPDSTFTTQRSGESLGVGGLPDNRQWELVSPPDKYGATLVGFAVGGSATQASEDGGAITYAASSSTEANPPGDQSPERVQVFSARGGGGGGSSSWSSRDIATPHDAPTLEDQTGAESEYKLFSGDLSFGLVEAVGETPLSPETSEHTPYLRDNVGDSYQPLVTAVNAPGVKFANQVKFVGATPDFSHVVLESGVPLVEGGGGLYEWSASKPPSEQLQPMSVLPKSEGGSVVNAGVESLSNDGSYFFSYGGHLYVHDPERDESMRVRVAPSAASEGEPALVFASKDGSKLLFSDSAHLTSAPEGGTYECRLAEVAGQLVCTQLVLTGLSVEGTVIGTSKEGDYWYFVGAGDKLYVDHGEGADWTTTFITQLSGDDSGDWSPEKGELQRLTSRVSPDGRWLAFMSNSSLTGYDNVDANPGAYEKEEILGKLVTVYNEGKPVPAHDEEVYLYDAAANKLVCASCNPTGARPTGIFDIGKSPAPLVDTAEVWKGRARWLAGLIPGWTPINNKSARYQSRYLSDGGRLFFESSDALVPQDTNGTEDVYEYEPAVGPGGTEVSPAQAPPNDSCGTGSSTYSARSEGCIGLVSSGTSGEESAFLDASENGEDVFFLTAAKLVPQDKESSLSLYDAHVCGAEGVPCPPPPPATPPACTNSSDSCRAAPSPQPSIFSSPPSATFSGVGNLAPAVVVKKVTKKTVKCKRGYVKNKKGRCIKNKKKKKAKLNHGKGSK